MIQFLEETKHLKLKDVETESGYITQVRWDVAKRFKDKHGRVGVLLPLRVEKTSKATKATKSCDQMHVFHQETLKPYPIASRPHAAEDCVGLSLFYGQVKERSANQFSEFIWSLLQTGLAEFETDKHKYKVTVITSAKLIQQHFKTKEKENKAQGRNTEPA